MSSMNVKLEFIIFNYLNRTILKTRIIIAIIISTKPNIGLILSMKVRNFPFKVESDY